MTKNENYYKLNAARCLWCEMTLVATEKGELHRCNCEKLVVTGDRSSCGIQRYTDSRHMYQELSQYSTGHPIAPGHARIRPLSALEDIKPGGWFVQNQLDESVGGWYRGLDEFGQALWEDEITVGVDGFPWSKAIFRFRPVAGYKLYRCGDVSEKAVEFHRFILDKVVPPFMENGQTKQALIDVLVAEGFQDRSGMGNEGKWRT